MWLCVFYRIFQLLPSVMCSRLVATVFLHLVRECAAHSGPLSWLLNTTVPVWFVSVARCPIQIRHCDGHNAVIGPSPSHSVLQSDFPPQSGEGQEVVFWNEIGGVRGDFLPRNWQAEGWFSPTELGERGVIFSHGIGRSRGWFSRTELAGRGMIFSNGIAPEESEVCNCCKIGGIFSRTKLFCWGVFFSHGIGRSRGWFSRQTHKPKQQGNLCIVFRIKSLLYIMHVQYYVQYSWMYELHLNLYFYVEWKLPTIRHVFLWCQHTSTTTVWQESASLWITSMIFDPCHQQSVCDCIYDIRILI